MLKITYQKAIELARKTDENRVRRESWPIDNWLFHNSSQILVREDRAQLSQEYALTVADKLATDWVMEKR